MLLGRHFRLTRATTGLHVLNGTGKVVSVPAGGIIKVLSSPRGTELNDKGLICVLQLHAKGLVYVLWEGNTVALFAVDVEARGIEIKDSASDRRQLRESASA